MEIGLHRQCGAGNAIFLNAWHRIAGIRYSLKLSTLNKDFECDQSMGIGLLFQCIASDAIFLSAWHWITSIQYHISKPSALS